MNPYAHFRVADEERLLNEYREQVDKLLMAMYTSGVQHLADTAGDIEDYLYEQEQQDQAELADREGWKEDDR